MLLEKRRKSWLEESFELLILIISYMGSGYSYIDAKCSMFDTRIEGEVDIILSQSSIFVSFMLMNH